MDLLTMKEAKSKGLTRYFTGVPCPYGHIAERIVSTRACAECARNRKHRWNTENPEKVKAWNLANQKLHRNSANARNRKWYAINPNAKAKKTAWAKAHPEVGVAKTVRYLTAKKHQYPAWADHKAIKMMYRAAQV